jgi:hypothetical protein
LPKVKPHELLEIRAPAFHAAASRVGVGCVKSPEPL